MRATAAAVQARRASRSGIISHGLIWVRAQNRATGGAETLGLWTGADHQIFMGRTYYGAGGVLNLPEIRTEIGLAVRSLSIGLSAVSPEVELLLRGYEPKSAPIEIHRAEFDDGGNLLATPERMFRGWINRAPIIHDPIEDQDGNIVVPASATIDCVSNSRMLTLFGKNVKSDAQQRERQGDRFRRHATAAAEAEVEWGERRHRPSVSRNISQATSEQRSGIDR
jgi:hypothetical protein